MNSKYNLCGYGSSGRLKLSSEGVHKLVVRGHQLVRDDTAKEEVRLKLK